MELIEKSSASAQGRQFYFTGKPCKRGHVDRRRVSTSVCIACERAANEGKREANRNRKREVYASNPEIARKRNNEYRAANRDRIRETARQRYALNPEPVIDASRAYREANKERDSAARKTDEGRARMREQARKRLTCAKNRINASMRTRLTKSLKVAGLKKDGRLFELVGYSRDELLYHLARQFAPGMGWHNFGEWHIDHIIPLSKFSFSSTSDPEFVAAWALSNLKPLWADKNLSKGSKVLSLL